MALEADSCAICYGEFHENEVLHNPVSLNEHKCGHVFHPNCLNKLLETGPMKADGRVIFPLRALCPYRCGVVFRKANEVVYRNDPNELPPSERTITSFAASPLAYPNLGNAGQRRRRQIRHSSGSASSNCTICGRYLKDKHARSRHKINFHGTNTDAIPDKKYIFPCTVAGCKQKYLYRFATRKHMITKHKKTVPEKEIPAVEYTSDLESDTNSN